MGARPSSFTVETPVVETDTRVWSPQQQAIFEWFETNTHTNLVVTARAGTGKTTTILEGINRAPEENICLLAFNKDVAVELKTRLTNPRAEAMTSHSLGMRMIQRQWRRMPVADPVRLRADSLTDLVCTHHEKLMGEKVPFGIKKLISTLHTKGREMCPLLFSHDELMSLAFRFECVPDDNWPVPYDVEFVVAHALAAMEHAATEPPTYDVGIDFADMLFLPLTHKLTARDFDLVVVDEGQDWTLSQLELAQRVCSGRMCIVGDDRQAIYGFRGADSSALGRLTKALDATTRPLTVTYRCGHDIVTYANQLVPDIEAHASNPKGVVETIEIKHLLEQVQPGDFVLSRLNAPLVAITLALLRKQIRARMAGRDLGKGIMEILKKCRCSDRTPVIDIIERVKEWERKTVARLLAYGQEEQIGRIRDNAGMIYALCEDAGSAVDLLHQCEYLFVKPDDNDNMVLCSSIHKAKGLEADRVFLLLNTLYLRGETPEEHNIHYVGATRAKSRLTLVV